MLFTLILISLLIIGGEGAAGDKYNILMLTSPVGSRGHSIFLNSIAVELAKRGHKVTHRCVGQLPKAKGVVNHEFIPRTLESVSYVGQHLQVIVKVVNDTYNDPLIVDIIKHPFDAKRNAPKYDVLVVDELLCEVYLPLAYHIGVPTVLATINLAEILGVMWQTNIPLPWAYYNPYGFEEPMDLIQRTKSVLFNLRTLFWLKLFRYPMVGSHIRSFLPDSPSSAELISNTSFVLVNSHAPVQERLPSMPYKQEIGCPQCRPPRPLPPILNENVEKSGNDGIIYVSVANFLKSDAFVNDFKLKVVSVLSRFPQKIIWRDEERLGIIPVPENFRTSREVPQQDLLGHPKMRLLIMIGGGIMTMHEALYHAVPILGFPHRLEQFQVMQHVKRLGYGDFLNMETFTEKELRLTISRLLNTKYKKAAEEASILMKDRPYSALNVSVHYIEYAVRHQGAHFLKSDTRNLNLFQYFLLDCIFVVFLVLLLLLIIVGCLLNLIRKLFVFIIFIIQACVRKLLLNLKRTKRREKKDN